MAERGTSRRPEHLSAVPDPDPTPTGPEPDPAELGTMVRAQVPLGKSGLHGVEYHQSQA